jgi:hypothetical protein
MIGLGEFFKKVQNSFSKELLLRATIKNVISKYTGIDLKIEDISYKAGLITLKNISQAARSVVFIKKRVILEEIYNQKIGQEISDIK